MRSFALLTYLFLLVILAGCTTVAAPVGGGEMRQPKVDTPALGQVTPRSPAHFPARPAATPHPGVIPSIAHSDFITNSNGIQGPAQAHPSPQPEPRLCSPLADTPLEQLSTIIADPYRPPPPGSEARHHGLDFSYYRKFNRATIEGAGIQSVLEGFVAAVIADRFPYGNMVIIETPASLLPSKMAALIQMGEGESLYVLYAHMERPAALRLGDNVEACQPLGKVGRSGNAGGPHLHLEMRLGPAGARFAGMAYYLPWASQEERENYVLWRTSGLFRHFDPMLILGAH